MNLIEKLLIMPTVAADFRRWLPPPTSASEFRFRLLPPTSASDYTADSRLQLPPPTVAADSRLLLPPPTFAAEFRRRLSQPTFASDYTADFREKMKYKGDFSPSELLCPTSLSWHPLSSSLPLLRKFAFTPLDPDLAAERATATNLSRYAPCFAGLKDFNFHSVSLDLGERSGLLSLRNLNERGQAVVKKLLMELFTVCGGDILSNFIVVLQ